MKRANSRQTNVLLQKDDVGRPKPNTRRLPSAGWIYGKPEVRDNEGAPEGKIYPSSHGDSNHYFSHK